MTLPSGNIPTFEPRDLAWLAKAFDGAVIIAADENGPFAILPVHELRRRLASAVFEAACHGVRDINLLRAQALRTVASRLQAT